MTEKSFQAESVSDQVVQTMSSSGEWLFLKDAAERLEVSEKTLRRYIKKKKYRTRRLGKSTNAPIQVLLQEEDVTVDAVISADVQEDLDHGYSDEAEEEIDFSPDENREDLRQSHSASLQNIVEECIKPLVSRIEQQALAISERDRIIEDQGRQLRLLPDLEKQAEKSQEVANLKAVESQALKTQIAAMEAEKQESDLVSSRRLEEIGKEAEELKKNLESIEAEKKKTEDEAAERIKEVQVSAEELKKQLDEMKAEVETLRTPWWKKWFMPVDPEN